MTGRRAYLAELISLSGELLGLCVPEEVSAAEVRLLTTRAYPAGVDLWLAPQVPHPLAHRRFAFRAERCLALEGGGYLLVGAFHRVLLRDEVEGLGGVESP